MWSGPRNISTAMMRSWGNRPDTVVVDEPFYAYYLARTGADHPGADEVIAQGEKDWRKVVARLTSEAPAGKLIVYQKQMTHHLLPEVERAWLSSLTNCFLIRDPADVIASYARKNHEPALLDLGFVQQAEIFDFVVATTGRTPPVIEARDVQENPAPTLRRLCEAIEVEFTEAMLSWAPGVRETDGVWAKHWYAEVANSTAFRASEPHPRALPEHLRVIHEQCLEIYERLREFRLH